MVGKWSNSPGEHVEEVIGVSEGRREWLVLVELRNVCCPYRYSPGSRALCKKLANRGQKTTCNIEECPIRIKE